MGKRSDELPERSAEKTSGCQGHIQRVVGKKKEGGGYVLARDWGNRRGNAKNNQIDAGPKKGSHRKFGGVRERKKPDRSQNSRGGESIGTVKKQTHIAMEFQRRP